MPRLLLTPAAQASLIEIADYVESASGSLETAERFVLRLIEKCEELASLPGHLGRERSELLPDLRSIAQGNYVIFFRYAGDTDAPDTFEVVNILEGHRDIDAYFAKRLMEGD